MLRAARSVSRAALFACLAAPVVACGRNAETRTAAGSTDIRAFDSTSVRHIVLPEDTGRTAPRARLSPLADSLSHYMTFLASFQNVFVAASRAGRLLVDVGRIDTKVATPARKRAYEAAAHELAPLGVGDRVRLRGPWGASDATVSGFDVWNGRMVATLDAAPDVDSLARGKRPLVATATRADSATPPSPSVCLREPAGATAAAGTPRAAAAPLPPEAARIDSVRDSLLTVVRGDTAGLPPSAIKSLRVRSSRVAGCFGAARVLLFVNASGDAYAFVRERAVLVDTTGAVVPLRVRDIRFRAHDALGAFDADGDGVDDVAALGRGPGVGGTVVLRLDLEKRSLDYVMSGFSWEG